MKCPVCDKRNTSMLCPNCGFDTSHVTNMSSMFSWCTALRELDLSGFDTSGLQHMSNMFYECPAGSKWQHLLQ